MARMIDADALIRAMGIYTYMETEWTPATAWGVPIVDAEPVKHGHWVFSPKDAIEMMFTLPKCSECGAESSDGGNYCPNCGAKMDNGEREEDADT